jgi:hypothetical protein
MASPNHYLRFPDLAAKTKPFYFLIMPPQQRGGKNHPLVFKKLELYGFKFFISNHSNIIKRRIKIIPLLSRMKSNSQFFFTLHQFQTIPNEKNIPTYWYCSSYWAVVFWVYPPLPRESFRVVLQFKILKNTNSRYAKYNY